MTAISDRVLSEHRPDLTLGQPRKCICGVVIGGLFSPHVAAMTEAAVRETIAADIEAAVLPTHPNTGYRDGITRAARIARG